MDNSQNNTSTLPDKNEHNSFAKIIKNLFEKDFTFSDCWYERITTNEVDLWKKFLHAVSRILHSKEMGNLINISDNILKTPQDTEILKNLVGQFQSIEVSF